MKVAGLYLFTYLSTMTLSAIVVAKSLATDGEVEVKLQFLEYELEDICVSKNEATWKFLNGTDPDLKKLLHEEIKESNLYKNELEIIQKHTRNKFSTEKLKRLVDIFFHPGAPLLGSMEFKEYRDYSIKLEEMAGTMEIECPKMEFDEDASTSTNFESQEKCIPIDYKKINKILYVENNEAKLKDVWTKWYRTLESKNKKTKYDFVQQLSILDLEAEQNGEEELTEYWLKQSDITWVNYDSAKLLWKDIQPLYEKMRKYMLLLTTQTFGRDVSFDNKLLPAHVLGSLKTYDWVTAAQKLGAFHRSATFKALNSSIALKNYRDLYELADNQTAEMRLGYLPRSFYVKSRFNESSQRCQNRVMEFCERDNIIRAMACAHEVPTVNSFIQINENTLRMKYLMLAGQEEEDNGYLFREGPRHSVLYEAMDALSSLRALSLENLRNQQLLPSSTSQTNNILNLFISALHILPSLPFYLSADLWRINALQEIDAVIGENPVEGTTTLFPTVTKNDQELNNTQLSDEKDNSQGSNAFLNHLTAKSYDTQNLTRDWWRYKEEFQGIGSPDGNFYDDYLQETYIIWNKPYLRMLMQKGKSKTWEFLTKETFNITQISAKPLLKYFEPLQAFLEEGLESKNQGAFFASDDHIFVSQGFSLNPNSSNPEGEGEKPGEGSDALFFSLAVVAAVAIVAVIVTVGRRRYKKRQRTRERKRLAQM